MEPIAIDVQEAARVTSLSTHTLRLYIRQKKLRAVHVGRRVVIPVAELHKLVTEGIDPAPSDLRKQEGRIQ